MKVFFGWVVLILLFAGSVCGVTFGIMYKNAKNELEKNNTPQVVSPLQKAVAEKVEDENAKPVYLSTVEGVVISTSDTYAYKLDLPADTNVSMNSIVEAVGNCEYNIENNRAGEISYLFSSIDCENLITSELSSYKGKNSLSSVELYVLNSSLNGSSGSYYVQPTLMFVRSDGKIEMKQCYKISHTTDEQMEMLKFAIFGDRIENLYKFKAENPSNAPIIYENNIL